MNFKKVCIAGPGAIGGMIAVKLAQAGCEVSALARPRRADAINANGLTLKSKGEVSHAKVRAAVHGDALGPQDLVVVALKNTALWDIAPELPALCGPDTPLLFAMNGLPWWFCDGFGALAGARLESLDPDGLLARTIPLSRVVWGIVNFSVSGHPDGTIEHTNANRLDIGRPDGSLKGLDAICALFAAADYDCQATTQIRADIWRKLAMNVALNPAGALTLGTITEMYHEPALRDAMVAVLDEMRAVGVKLGIDPGPHKLDAYQNAKVRVSMLQDLEQNRPLEIGSIVEGAFEIGAKAGVPMPLTGMLLGLIRLRARTAGLLTE